jgi:hypothetical protein
MIYQCEIYNLNKIIERMSDKPVNAIQKNVDHK